MSSTSAKEREPLLSSPEVSDYIKVPKRTLDQWAYLGTGPAFIKVGGHRRYRPSDIERWLDSRVRGGEAA